MKKKIILLIINILLFSFSFSNVKAEVDTYYCNKDAAEELIKILTYEVGGPITNDTSEDFFAKITTASVIVNNTVYWDASYGGANYPTFADKIYNLRDGQYSGHSTYRDKTYRTVMDSAIKNNSVDEGKLVYVTELVLSGVYALPSNMLFQAADYILDNFNAEHWAIVDSKGNLYDVHFGYTGTLNDKDIFGNKIINNTSSYYRSLAKSLEKTDYSKYTIDNICSNNLTVPSTPTVPGDEVTTIVDACVNPEVLKVIYFLTIILDIIRIALPIGLIVFGTIDLSKAVISNSEGDQKKNLKLFGKRILFAVLVFAVPWIVEVLMISLGSLTEDVNFTDCLKNANSEMIKDLETKIKNNNNCYYCKDTDSYTWAKGEPDANCASGWKVKDKYVNSTECTQNCGGQNACYYCAELDEYRWTNEKPTMYCSRDKDWEKRNDMDEGECLKQDPNSCYYCAEDDIYLWRESIPELHCSGTWKRMPSMTKKECETGKINNSGTNFSNTYDKNIFIGDSRANMICVYANLETSSIETGSTSEIKDVDCVAKGSMGYNWFVNTATPNLENMLKKSDKRNVIIYIGTNDLGTKDSGESYASNSASKYAKKYNELADKYPNTNFLIVSVTEINDTLMEKNNYYKVYNEFAINFNNTMQSNLNKRSNLKYCDVYSKIENNYETTDDGIHYTKDTSIKIYQEIEKCLN